MRRKVVAMPLIPGRFSRGPILRSDLAYARFSRATWKWWCERHGIEFVVIDQPPGGEDTAHLPPTIQRWLIPERIIRERGADTLVAVVDADTMIRWDTPDFLAQAHGFTAVIGINRGWIARSMDAFRPLFPDVALPWWEYVNAGLVVVGEAQLRTLSAFLTFSREHWAELYAVTLSGDFGTDQTPLNFILRRENEPVHFLPPPFNFVQCFPMGPALQAIEDSPLANPGLFAEKAFSRPWAFKFVELGYVWHFTNVVAYRALVMQEVWRRVREHYPGAAVEGA